MSFNVRGSYDKARFRAEMAIRLEIQNLGLTDAEIAEHIGLTPGSYAIMKMRPEYKQLRTQMITGVLSDLDAEIGADTRAMRDKLRKVGVPLALETLLKSASQTADPKLALEASKQILDRDGRLVPVSKTTIVAAEEGININHGDDLISDALVAAVAAQRKKEQSNIDTAKPATATVQ